MKILWANANFLHPTTKGGQIRTLEMMKCLHREHEIHYVAFSMPGQTEGPARAHEYATHVHPIPYQPPARGSLAFALQVAGGLFHSLPLAVSRWAAPAMRDKIRQLLARETFDSVVCDFLAPAPNFDSLAGCVLFQHNVETVIWRRHAETAQGFLRRAYFDRQARLMEAYERDTCRQAGHVIAVSDTDARRMRDWFQIPDVSWVPTGVNLAYFDPSQATPDASVPELVFTGSMDWMPNIDGIQWFAAEVMPRILAKRPQTRAAIVGRDPAPSLRQLAERNPAFLVTGTVPDIRPWLWNAAISVVPLRVGGGTRIKIFEAVAAGVPVVSTTIGAEGLPLDHPRQIRIADTPESFADTCLELLDSPERRAAIAREALGHVAAHFSWDAVAAQFAAILERFPHRRP